MLDNPVNLSPRTIESCVLILFETEVEIYKRKKESKKTRKHAFDQESDQEKREKTRSRPSCVSFIDQKAPPRGGGGY